MSLHRWLFVSVVAAVIGALSCGDPVHEAEVSALGPEAAGVPQGPTHRPGQPCLTCHGGQGPGGLTFVTAGTIYLSAYPIAANRANALASADVHLVDANGSTYDATTNTVGNFFVTTDQWNPVFPLGAHLPDAGTQADGGAAASVEDITVAPAGDLTNTTPMNTAVERGGVYASCAYCHFDPPGPSSAGHIYQD